jgi:hypothetical protein
MPRLATPLLALLAVLLLAVPAHAQRHHDDAPGDGPVAESPVPVEPEVEVEPGEEDPVLPDPSWLPELPEAPEVVTTTLKVVPGAVARMRADGRAAVPHDAPARIRAVIRAANAIVGRPYRWGGGHARVVDSGYDCSGAVSYALIKSGQLRAPLVSGELARTYAAGRGRWLTIYANRGHVYLEVAGLRLDTSGVGDPAGREGVRWRPVVGQRTGFRKRHLVGL